MPCGDQITTEAQSSQSSQRASQSLLDLAQPEFREVVVERRTAPKGRKTFSLGREPQELSVSFFPSREAATDVPLSTELKRFCRPLQGLMFLLIRGSWGSRPRLSICRRFAAHLIAFRVSPISCSLGDPVKMLKRDAYRVAGVNI